MSSIVFASTTEAPEIRTNYISNPSFSYGGTRWSPNIAGTTFTVEGGLARAFTSDLNGGAVGVASTAFAVPAGARVWGRARVGVSHLLSTNMSVHMRFRFMNASGTVLGTQSRTVSVPSSDGARTTHDLIAPAMTPPTGTTQCQIVIETGPEAEMFDTLYVDNVLAEHTTTTTIPYFDGDTPSAGGVVYAWTAPIPFTGNATRTTYRNPIAPALVTDWSAEHVSSDVILEPVGAAYPVIVRVGTVSGPRTGRMTAMFDRAADSWKLLDILRQHDDVYVIDSMDVKRSMRAKATRVETRALTGHSQDLREVSFDYVMTGAV